MEPTIYKPSIYKGSSIYKTGAGGGEIEIGSLWINAQDKYSTYGFFKTPIIPLDTASLIEENLRCKAYSFSLDDNSFHDGGGQWWTNGTNFYGIAPYFFSDKIELDYGNGIEEFFNDINYNLTDVIDRNIVYDKLNNKAIVNISYNGINVFSHEMALDNVVLHNTPFTVGGRRMLGSTTYVFNGEIDLSKTYIKIDGNLFWGVES